MQCVNKKCYFLILCLLTNKVTGESRVEAPSVEIPGTQKRFAVVLWRGGARADVGDASQCSRIQGNLAIFNNSVHEKVARELMRTIHSM